MDGKKKGPAKWKHYATEFRIRDLFMIMSNVALTVTSDSHALTMGTTQVTQLQEQGNTGNTSNWSHHVSIGVAVKDPVELQKPDYLYYKAWSRGTDANHYVEYCIENGVLK